MMKSAVGGSSRCLGGGLMNTVAVRVVQGFKPQLCVTSSVIQTVVLQFLIRLNNIIFMRGAI